MGSGKNEDVEKKYGMSIELIIFKSLVMAIFMMVAFYYARKKDICQELYYIMLAIVLAISPDM